MRISVVSRSLVALLAAAIESSTQSFDQNIKALGDIAVSRLYDCWGCCCRWTHHEERERPKYTKLFAEGAIEICEYASLVAAEI